jgi:hypothetical protein
MTGGKNMSKRGYTRVKASKEKIYELKREGKSNQEIAEKLGYADKWVVKGFIKRENKKEKGIIEASAKTRGRPRKKPVSTARELIKENERLKMENELLRDFLKEIERG